MELSSQMMLFAHVVEHGTFSAAARALDHAPSAVSRQIGQLEDRLGVRLLQRSRHGLTLTEAGTAFHARCLDIATRVVEAKDEAMAMGAKPLGELRVCSTVAFGRTHLVPALQGFMAANPGLRLSLELTDRPVDIAADNIDAAIRFSEQIDDPSVVSRKLARNQRVICASPAYLERAGIPRTPDDLAQHNCLRLSTVDGWNDWSFGVGAPTVHATGDFEASSADGVYHATLAGIGIARLPTYLVGPDIRSGRLVRLLDDLIDAETDIVLVYADRRNLPAKIRVFIDHLVAHFAGRPPWELDVGEDGRTASAA